MMWARFAIIFCSIGLVACGHGQAEAVVPPSIVDAPPVAGGYRLPVKGKWRVHRDHYNHAGDQSSGVDLVKLGPVGDGARNEGYPSYRQEIVADAAGIVALAVDGNPDNPPKKVNKYDQHGNFVVIDHRNGEFSLLAHFIPGSIRVRPGQPVQAGDVLGLCGNSGRSTMPHVHWQVMDNWLAHEAKGVPIRMAPYLNNGKPSQQRLERGASVEAIER